MKVVENDAELRRLHVTGEGLIYNDVSGRGASGKDYNALHLASCRWVLRSNVNARKYFFASLDEAVAWLKQNREGNWRSCSTCKPAAASLPTPLRGPREQEATESPMREEPFTEEQVERILIKHLQGRGYKVRRQVLVASGTVDILAEGRDGRWVIEVKGEDRGGYTSAEMNFQMGIGQIVSRMTDPETSYALAFPMTSDFKKVLRKYKGSFGLRRLRLRFYAVYQSGNVDEYDAQAMEALIERA